MAKRPARTTESNGMEVMSIAVPEKLRDRVSYFLGDEIVKDPRFWMMALHKGIDELLRQYREIEEKIMDDIMVNGGSVIIGPAIVVERSDSPINSDDDLPF